MKKALKIGGFAGLLTAILVACSTEKNTLINRTYHGLTAHYNGYFNANDLIDQSMETYRTSRQEDYYKLLPIDPVPSESEVVGMYPAIDTAIAKCKKVIRNHSMPSNDRPAKKKDEHNPWIDENWTTIGIASYYRRDYEGAMKSFEYVRKFYTNDPSLYIGELWMAKTHMEQGELTKAKFNLDNLDKAIADEDARKDEKKPKSKFAKKKKKKEEEIAKFPKRIRYDLEKTKARLALMRDERKEAINYLEEALKHARLHDDVERVHFILGQLYQEEGNGEKAKFHYTKVVKGKASYDMSFNARLKRAFMGGGDKVKKELHKMLKDAKNAEFKDQIYYALAEIEFNEGNDQLGIKYLHDCAFYSTRNTRQKGMAYERLGDISFQKRDYIKAQKYYDSCGVTIDDNYPNAEGIRNKADNLYALVSAVEIAHYEDSVQRIAAMSESDREKFLKGVIKQIKDEEQARKEREAARLRELQENQNLFVQAGNGSKWYWNNPKTRAEGFNEFKRLWGQRENEDDWRRSDKIVTQIVNDTISGDDPLVVEEEDTLTVENLLAYIPLNDTSMVLSNQRLMKGYYDAGIIYKEQLNEPKLAEEQFTSVLDRKIQTDPHDLMAAFQMYKIHENDASKRLTYKDYIMNNYPNSDYANFLRDPNYFIKKKEREALAEQEYVRVFGRYERGLYYPVITKADKVINEEKDNRFRVKYMMLKAFCLGHLEEDKTKLLPTLEMVVKEYPESEEAVKANEMIGIIKNGYSEHIPADFSNNSVFSYDDKAKLKVIIFVNGKLSNQAAQSRVADFNREYFSRDGLGVDAKLYGKDQGVLLVQEFDTEMDAGSYIRAFKKTRKHLLDLQNAKIYMISSDNLKVLFQRLNLQDYETFYEEYY